MAPVIKALSNDQRFRSVVCATGQHRQMLNDVLSLFQISPEYNFNIMKEKQDLTDITCEVLHVLRQVIREDKPDLLLVQGDTTTTMAAALAAYYEKVPLHHIEAGLRTGNNYSPWPEEGNRKIVSVIADLHFAPTEQAKRNLIREGISERNIIVTGNTIIDALLGVLDGINYDHDFIRQMHEQYPFLDNSRETGHAQKIILVTGHRRESFGEGFENICHALKELAQHLDVKIVYPVHLNPHIREPVFRILGGKDNIELLEPLDYRSFVYFMNRAYLILTDSGGVQEEAPSLGKPVLVMRDTTERPEAVDTGTVKLVGTNRRLIVEETERLLYDGDEYQRMARKINPYGDGKASARIVEAILAYCESVPC